MLVLARKSGQSVFVGEQVINVLMIMQSAVFIELVENDEAIVLKRLKLGQELELKSGRAILSTLEKSLVRLMFDVPDTVQILRSELKVEIQRNSYVNKQKEQKELAAISNISPQNSSMIDDLEKKVMVLELLSNAAPDSVSKLLNQIARDLLKVA